MTHTTPIGRGRRAGLVGTIGAAALLLLGPVSTASADSVASGTASAFGATISAAGETVIPPTPEQTTELPPGGENTETVVDIPADPLALSGTLTANTAVHQASDIPSTLVTETVQDVEGPYNALAEGVVEEAEVLVDLAGEGVSLLTADVIRAEAVGVCSGETVEYSATSEVIGLSVAGEQLPLNPPVQDLVDAIGDLLTETGLNAVVDVQRDVVTPTADGVAVDALVVTVLAAAGDDPLAQVRIGHAEVNGLACGELPECSDGVDNDGDGAIDFPDDPDCESAADDSESPECSDGVDNDGDGAIDLDDPDCDSAADDSESPECSDGVDNDGDGAIDMDDPGCDSPEDDSEADDAVTSPNTAQRGDPSSDRLARTGGGTMLPVGAALAVLALAGHRLLAIRRN